MSNFFVTMDFGTLVMLVLIGVPLILFFAFNAFMYFCVAIYMVVTWPFRKVGEFFKGWFA